MPSHFAPPDPPPIDVSSPDSPRTSFQNTNYDSALPLIQARFPNVDPLYFTKIFRGTIQPVGLIWLDVDREYAAPADFLDIAHLLYCFEVYGQILCIFVGENYEAELQSALADYRIRILKWCKVATFESLRDWHKAFLEVQIRNGQDRADGWRAKREELGFLLKGRV
ncbi:hypothetical protein MMC21_007963 [Puttea exsequens]|nr:hypothetical protein [Puttea exsequens]